MATVAFLFAVVGLVLAVRARRDATTGLQLAEEAVERLESELAQLKQLRPALSVEAVPAVPAAQPASARQPVPVGRDTLLAVVHHQLAGLEQRRRATQAAPAPQDRVPRLPVDGDGLPRLAATHAGPLDAAAGVPQAGPGEPFHYSGTVEGDTVDEFAIDWPEPGAPAMAIATGKVEKDYLTITGMTRTRSRITTHNRIITGWPDNGVVRRRSLLATDMTHFKVESHGGRADWSVQLVGPADLDRLVDEREGNGSYVLAVAPGQPMEALVHANSSSWTVEFVCGCWAGDDCECSKPEELGWFDPWIHQSGEGMCTLIVPRPGLLVGQLDEEADPWRLRLRPIGSED
jgi:hypothetical protein